MNTASVSASILSRLSQLLYDLNRIWTLISCLVVALLRSAYSTAAAEQPTAVLEFIQPTNNAVFSTHDEIPIVLQAFATNDVFLTGEVFANEVEIALVSYCCAECPCFYPIAGQETILQIPVPRNGATPPLRSWQGWTNVPAGTYQLTGRAVGQNGTVVETVPVTIQVLDLSLRMFVETAGTVMLVIPQGSLVPGRFDLEASQDLSTWTRLGTFAPGNVAAFYSDMPPDSARARRFYRSLHFPGP